ncbi:MAG: glycine zipper 2TM domain-containing protein [Magnetococcales bacterium]|nr:glycine zipper 2TM domain-containing protein [Magnetococcales bacterium]NGZ04831.1 glycine zipper 2TM domain-containing protein [Magnetococcales bacterium]
MLMKRCTIPLLTLSLLAGGCASTNTTPGQPASQQSSNTDTTTMQGAGAGAVIGGVIGAILGKESGAAIGALAGAAIGGVLGNLIGDMQEQRLAREDNIEKQIMQTREVITAANQYNQESRAELDRILAESKRLLTNKKNGNLKKDDIEKHLAFLDQKQKSSNDAVTSLKTEYNAKKESLDYHKSQQQPAQNNPQIAEMEKQLDSLQAAIQETSQSDTQYAHLKSIWR